MLGRTGISFVARMGGEDGGVNGGDEHRTSKPNVERRSEEGAGVQRLGEVGENPVCSHLVLILPRMKGTKMLRFGGAPLTVN